MTGSDGIETGGCAGWRAEVVAQASLSCPFGAIHLLAPHGWVQAARLGRCPPVAGVHRTTEPKARRRALLLVERKM